MKKFIIDVLETKEFTLVESFELHAKTKDEAETMGLGVIEYKYGGKYWDMCLSAR